MTMDGEETPHVICAGCGAVIGEYANGPDRAVWLRVGHLLLSSANGICECGKRWSWCASDKKMEDLLERIKRRKFVFIDTNCQRVLTRAV